MAFLWSQWESVMEKFVGNHELVRYVMHDDDVNGKSEKMHVFVEAHFFVNYL